MRKSSVMLLFILCVTVLVVLFTRIFNSRTSNNNEIIDHSQVAPKNEVYFDFLGDKYSAIWVEVYISNDIQLIPNLQEKLTSIQAKDTYDCNILVNGGFYDKENNYLGLLISNSETISRSLSSNTFNSYLSISDDNLLSIDRASPAEDLRISLQTGPLLIEKDQQLSLKINNDKFARRVVAAKTNDGNLTFIIISDQSTGLSGPKLTDLPAILKNFENGSGVNIIDATNLDGGGASAFVTNEFKYTENQPVGSFFCVR